MTYLLEVQSSISRRDIGIIKLNTSAGNPPSAITLLERFAALRQRNALHEVLEEGRNWCATMRQSHSAHPSLIYFQSMATGAGWPAALGAILDVGLFAQHLIDDDRLYGPAVLLGEEGNRMARELAALVGVDRTDANTDPAELQDVVDRLASSGYPVRADPDFKTMSDFHQWFHFRLAGAAGQEVTLRITNCKDSAYPHGWPDYKGVMSLDREDWVRISATTYADGVLTMKLTPPQDLVWIAYFAPYSMERHHDLVSQTATIPGVEYRSLGQSVDGQDIDCLTIGEGPLNVWLYARQHPGESMWSISMPILPDGEVKSPRRRTYSP